MQSISNVDFTVDFAVAARDVRPQLAPRQVLLRRWGFSEQEAASLLPDLVSLDGLLTWTLEERRDRQPDLVIHLIDATRLSGVHGGARWNAMGPVDAMRKARQRGTSEIALVLGSTQHLPVDRVGCWVLAGERSLAAALNILARTTIEPLLASPNVASADIHDLASMNALCILAREQGQDRDALASRMISVLWTACNRAYRAPKRVLLAAQAHVVDLVDTFNPQMRDRIRPYRRQSGPLDLSAEFTIVYPWCANAMLQS